MHGPSKLKLHLTCSLIYIYILQKHMTIQPTGEPMITIKHPSMGSLGLKLAFHVFKISISIIILIPLLCTISITLLLDHRFILIFNRTVIIVYLKKMIINITSNPF